MAKRYIILLLLLFHLSSLHAETYSYKVTAMGIPFARAGLSVERSKHVTAYDLHLRTRGAASLFFSLDIRYLALVHRHTPLLLEKIFNRNGVRSYHLDHFFSGLNITSRPVLYHENLHTLFSILDLLSSELPREDMAFVSVSCNTLWHVFVRYGGYSSSGHSYLFSFKNITPFFAVKKRYDDFLLKELYWNSGSALVIISDKGVIEKAVLESFSPDITLERTLTKKD